MYQIIARQWCIKSTHKVKLHQIAMWKAKLTCAPVIISQNQCPPVAVEAGASKAWFSWVASWKRHWLRDCELWFYGPCTFIFSWGDYRLIADKFLEKQNMATAIATSVSVFSTSVVKEWTLLKFPQLMHSVWGANKTVQCIKYLSQITKATPLRGTPWSWLEDFDIANVAISQRSSVWIGSSGVALGYCTGSSGRWRCSKHSTLWSLWLARLGLTGLSSKSGERCDSSRALALR